MRRGTTGFPRITHAAMKYHQLKAFVTVAEEGSIRAAARRLNVSPAALTKAVKELEIALGVSLVVRTARGVQLTAFGQQLHRARHQDIRVYRQTMITRCRLEAIDEELVVLVVDECGLLVESAQDHVLRLVGDIKTC